MEVTASLNTLSLHWADLSISPAVCARATYTVTVAWSEAVAFPPGLKDWIDKSNMKFSAVVTNAAVTSVALA